MVHRADELLFSMIGEGFRKAVGIASWVQMQNSSELKLKERSRRTEGLVVMSSQTSLVVNSLETLAIRVEACRTASVVLG